MVATSEQEPGRGVGRESDANSPVRELWDSLLLFGLTASSLGAFVGLGAAAVRVLAR